MLNNAVAVFAAPVPPVTNSYESIATATLSSAGTVSFTSIPSTFKHLQIRFKANNTTAANYKISLRFNSDSGSNYNWHWLAGDGSAASAGANDENTAMRLVKANYSTTNWTVGVIDLLDYANENKFKTGKALGGWDSNGGGTVELSSGLWRSTAAITQINIAPYAGNYEAGSTFALYGIKG